MGHCVKYLWFCIANLCHLSSIIITTISTIWILAPPCDGISKDTVTLHAACPMHWCWSLWLCPAGGPGPEWLSLQWSERAQSSMSIKNLLRNWKNHLNTQCRCHINRRTSQGMLSRLAFCRTFKPDIDTTYRPSKSAGLKAWVLCCAVGHDESYQEFCLQDIVLCHSLLSIFLVLHLSSNKLIPSHVQHVV